MVVVGGMTSLAGAVLGALFLFGAPGLDPEWQFLASGIGVLAVLLLAPGGLAGLAYQARDRWLRAVAARSGMSVAAAGRRSSPTAGSSPPPGARSPAPNRRARARGRPVCGWHRPPGTALLDVVGIEVGYGGVPVLFGVDLAVREGEAVALLGTNGRASRRCCGRSRASSRRGGARSRSTARPSPGWRPPGGGARRADARRRRRVPSLTVDENLQVAGWLHRRCRRHGRRAGPGARAVPGPGDRGHDLARSLSGGQQQMLALAMAVVMRPRLLMIDELSLGLAPAVVAELLRFVDHLRDEGHDAGRGRAIGQRGPRDRRARRLPRTGPGAVRGRRRGPARPSACCARCSCSAAAAGAAMSRSPGRDRPRHGHRSGGRIAARARRRCCGRSG